MKPIFLTEEDKEEMLKEFQEKLNDANLFDGSFTYTKKYYFDPKTAGPKAKILYTPMAWLKMQKLIQEFTSEIAWHGLVRRGEYEGEFIVYDILTFEQTVTGSTVTTEDEQQQRFFESLTDEQADNMFLQAHSHVNMGVTPSSTDLAHQTKIVRHMSTRRVKKFQIFQIWNKRGEVNSFIYDFADNVYYENKDIIVDILMDDGVLASSFIAAAKAKVVTRAYNYQSQSGYQTGAKKAEAPKPEPKKPAGKKEKDVDPDEDAYQKAQYGEHLKREFTESEIEDLKDKFRAWMGLPAHYKCENDDDWEDFLEYARLGYICA